MHPRITAWLALKGRKTGDESGSGRSCCALFFSQSFVKGLTVSLWKVATWRLLRTWLDPRITCVAGSEREEEGR